MERMTFQTIVGSDGILHVALPIGAGDANRPVQVTVEPANAVPKTEGDYATWVDSLAGSWQGEFVVDPLGPLETRDPPGFGSSEEATPDLLGI